MREHDPVPSIPSLAGRVQTVLGPIDPGQLGQTLSHEHVFIDLRRTHLPHRRWVVRDDRLVAEEPLEDFPATELAMWEAKLDFSNLHLARQLAPIADNYVFSDEAQMIAELGAFKEVGGGAIIDVTSIGLKRAPLALQRVSTATGLHIVMGTGHYQRVYHPDNMDDLTVEQLTGTIVRDVTVGVHDGLRQTDVRAGVIGEIGINGGPLITNERKAMRAAARASRLTGAPVLIHLGGVGQEPHEILDIAVDEGVDLRTVIQGHSDLIAHQPILTELLARGVTVAFDILGSEPEIAGPSRTSVVASVIPGLIGAGFGGQIVLAHDLCFKFLLKAYGGSGYTFIHESFLPQLRTLGVTESQIEAMMVTNPARAFTLAEPRP